MIVSMSGVLLFVFCAGGVDGGVRFQAHRGGLGEFPENTMAAYRGAWGYHALPEIDIRSTRDGVIICLHDATLARTTDAAEGVKDADVSTLTLEEVRKWDAGKWFSPQYAGEKVPMLEEVFAAMRGCPEREVYLDFKAVELPALVSLITRYEVGRQIIFCHNCHDTCVDMRKRMVDLRTMLWIGGKPAEIQAKYTAAAARRFEGLDQVQIHLVPEKGSGPVRYELSETFLKHVLEETRGYGIALEVLPFAFDEASLTALLDFGIRWYATDYPGRFSALVGRWISAKGGA